MDKLVINHLVEKDREGSYYSIPFDVPEGVRSLTVTYSYPRGGNVIDLGIEDGHGQFLGWSGSSRDSVTLGAFDATSGYLMKRTVCGTWHILVGAYRVGDGGVPVRYEITFTEEKPGWLFGDLHVHSDASDGQHDIPTLAAMAKKAGLDFLSVTNHNNYAENYSLPRVPGLTLIPGTEWTHYRGHMNFLGTQKPFAGSFIANSPEQMQAVIRQARERGALVSVNHPKCSLCPYLWGAYNSFQLVEVWNGPMRPTNLRGIAWWTELLRQGYRLPAVGGSDFHRDRGPVRLGNPVTAVYADSPGVEDILAAVARGRTYVTGGVRGVRLGMTCGEEMFGAVVSDGEITHTLSVSADAMPMGSVLEIVGSRGTLGRLRPRKGKVQAHVTVSDTSFAYLLAGIPMRGGELWPLAVSSPVYFE